MDVFQDRDAGYKHWKANNQSGYILAYIDDAQGGPSLVLHGASCPLLSRSDTLTKDWIGRSRSRRVCASTVGEVESWASRSYGLVLTRCGHCQRPSLEPRVEGSDLDDNEIVRRGGARSGAGSLTVLACPVCSDIYVVDADLKSMYVDGADLSRRVDLSGDTIECLECGGRMPVVDIRQAVAGDPTHASWRADWKAFRASPWAWAELTPSE
jgi:hypothetical protein